MGHGHTAQQIGQIDQGRVTAVGAAAALFLLPVFVHAELTAPVDGESSAPSSSSGSALEMFATWVGIISGITGIVSTIVGMVSKRRRTPPA